jgi:hypothetical protein
MIRTLSLLSLFACTTRYTYVADIGGELTVQLAPDADGFRLEPTTLPGMDEAEFNEMIDASSYRECPSPALLWATDTGTGEPLYGNLIFCIPEAALATEACPGPWTLSVELDGFSGQVYAELQSTGEEAGFITALDTWDLAEPLAPAGAIEGPLAFDGDCLGDDVPHTLALAWDFPDHTETVRHVRNDYSGFY